MTIDNTTATAFALELATYLEWLSALEEKAQHSPLLSRWYEGPVFSVYTRVSRFKPAVNGAPAICLANIEVSENLRGKGFLTALLARLSQPDTGLTSEFLYLESVINAGLARKLPELGFLTCPYSSDPPSFYRRRVPEQG